MSEWLNNIPLFWGKIIVVIGFLGMIIWIWFRPHSFIFKGAPDKAAWRDLRIWSTLSMVIMIILYLLF